MKMLLAALALAAAAISSPAVAQAWDPSVGSGNIVPPPYGGSARGFYGYRGGYRGYAIPGFNARAEAPRHFVRPHRFNQPRARYR